jgi:hypothetical protein
MAIGGLAVPISVISAIMFLVHSYGTANAGFLDSCIVILGPVVMLCVGFGLLRRWKWALLGTIALLAIVIVTHAWKLVEGSRSTTITTSPSGVPTTVIGSGPNIASLPIILLCAGLLARLLSGGVREEFQNQSSPPMTSSEDTSSALTDNDPRGWRVGHVGRDMMYYEERIAGAWHRIDIDGEMLIGRAHHVIYFASAERWQSYPEWARHRRTEIITRIKREFRAPDYEYQPD